MGMRKYAKIDFREADVVRWSSESGCSSQGFRCRRGEFVSFWKGERVHRDIGAHLDQRVHLLWHDLEHGLNTWPPPGRYRTIVGTSTSPYTFYISTDQH